MVNNGKYFRVTRTADGQIDFLQDVNDEGSLYNENFELIKDNESHSNHSHGHHHDHALYSDGGQSHSSGYYHDRHEHSDHSRSD